MMLTLIEPLTLRGEEVEAHIENVSSKTEQLEATVAAVADSAQVAMEHLAELQHKSQSDWSDWSLVDSEEYQELKARVEALEAGDPSVPVSGVDTQEPSYTNLLERLVEPEPESRRGLPGAGVGLPAKDRNRPDPL